jgi:hypothetical protein
MDKQHWKEILRKESELNKSLVDNTEDVSLTITKNSTFWGWSITVRGSEKEVIEKTSRLNELLMRKYGGEIEKT